jgi:LCP family protein required for cell wall assembly
MRDDGGRSLPPQKPPRPSRVRDAGQADAARSAARSPARRPSTRRLLGVGRALVLALSMVLLIGTGYGWAAYHDLSSGLTTSDALGNAPRSLDHSVNILLIGLDSRKDQNGQQLPPQILSQLNAGDGTEGGYNTNTLILVHVPADGSRATAFSIPRDDAVDIPGEHKDKIKKAYGYAKDKAEQQLRAQGVTDQPTLEKLSRDAGRKATLQVVRNLTGVPIDHFAEVNLAGFYDLATALGGVDVCLNHPVKDHYSGADFPAGPQTLNGSQALSFVRQRHGLTNGDLDRTHRQQAFLVSVAAKLRSAGTFTDTTKLSNLIDVAKRDVVIDDGWDVLTFAQQAQGLAGGNIEFQTLPIKGYATSSDGEDINVIDPAQIRTMVRKAFGVPDPEASTNASNAAASAPAASTATVDVDNASATDGLAAQVSDALAAQGFTKGAVGSADGPSKHSTVAYGPGAKTDAQRVAGTLGGLTVVAGRHVSEGHVLVTLGTHFEMPSSLQGADGAAPTSPQAVHASSDTGNSPQPPSTGDGPQGAPVVGGGDVPCVN